MNNQEKAKFKKFLKQEKCYKSFKRDYDSERNYFKKIPLRVFLNKEPTIASTLFNAFAWLRTVEGYQYWAKIHLKLLKL